MSDFPSSSSSSSFLLFLMIITFVTLSQPILAQSQQTTKYETGAENRLDVLLESLYDAANATSSEMIPNELTVLPSEIEESYSLDGLKQILSFTPSAERTSGIVMTDVANILRDAESYSIERIFMLLTNLRDSQSAVDTEAARVSKAQFEKCNAALKYYESATEALSERVERAKSSEARYEPKNTDTHLMDKSLKDLTRRIETIDTVTSEYDRVAGIHRKSSMNVLKDAIEQIEKLSNVASASVHGPRDGESVESLERDMAATGGGGEEELLLDEIPIVSLLELSSPSGIKPSNTLRSIREMQDNLFEVQDSLMKDTRDLTNVDDVVVPPVTAPVPSQREIEDIVDSDEKSSKVRLEIDKKLLKELLRRKEHLEMLCESLNETSRRFERDLNMSSEFGIVPETFPHLASHMLIADLGRLAEYVQNHTSLVVENETMSDAFLRAVPLISKEIRDAVISSSPGKEALRSVNVLICIHQVRSGDSLPSLAEKYDLTLRDLKDANPQLPWKLRHENGYPDINTTIFVPFDHYKPARCEKLYPCAISPSPVCSHGGIAARGPEGTKPGFGWLHTPLGRIAAGWAADAATGSAFEDWDGDSGLMSKAEKSTLERVAEAGESTARLFNSVRDNVKASGKDVIATSGLTPSPLSGMPVDSVKQLDVDMKKGPVPHDILAADSNLAFLELQRSSSSSKSRLKSKNQRKKLRGSNHDVLSKGDSVWVYGASAKHWLSGTVASTHEDGTYEITYPDGSISERVPIEGISTSEPSKPVADTSSSSSLSRIGEIDISVQCDVTSGPESPSCPEVEECDFSNAGDGCEIVTEYELMGMMCCAKPCNFKDTNGKSCGGLVSTTDSNVDDVVVTGIFDGALCDDVHEPCPSENCHGHGSVVEDNKGKKHCACDDGYVGESCEKCASSHYEEEAIPSEHNRGYDKTRKICRRCAPFITVNRADGHQYDEGATLETSCDVAAQVVTSVGGSGSGLWAQRDKLKVQYADLFLSLEGADLTSSARVEIHEFNVGSFPSGELVTDNALAIGYFNNTSDKGWSRFTFLPYAPISAGIDIVLALRLKDTSTKIEWHRDDKVDLSDKEAKAYMHCGGSWDEAEVLDGMDQPQFSYRLIACSG